MIDLKGHRVLVAGGAGFVGSQLVRELIGLGATTAVYDNFFHGTFQNIAQVRNDIELFIGDVLDEWALIDAFEKFQPEYVFDLVGDTYVPRAYEVPKRFFRINLEGTLNVLMACKTQAVKRALYVSSTEVYGRAQKPLMDEAHPFEPLNTYAVSKLAADRLCFTIYHEQKVPVIIGRIFNSYGPRETEPYVIPDIISQLSKGKVLRLGNIEARRDFTFVNDTCTGLIAALCSNIPNGESVNIGSGKAYSVKEIAAMIAELMGVTDFSIEIDPRRLRILDIDVFCCDNTRLGTATGWKPTVDIREGLRRTIQWYREAGAWPWESWIEGKVLGGDARRV
jgi:nucleoside-diphosphate-sugar epimerase